MMFVKFAINSYELGWFLKHMYEVCVRFPFRSLFCFQHHAGYLHDEEFRHISFARLVHDVYCSVAVKRIGDIRLVFKYLDRHEPIFKQIAEATREYTKSRQRIGDHAKRLLFSDGYDEIKECTAAIAVESENLTALREKNNAMIGSITDQIYDDCRHIVEFNVRYGGAA